MNEDVISNNTKHLIYGYFDNETKACYIGLTTEERLRLRHLEHLRFNKDKNKYDSVMTYFVNLNKPLPDPIVLVTKLTPREAQEKEALYIEYYRSLNYFIINIAKAGSLGGWSRYWIEERCYEEAKKYEKLSEFKRNSVGAYISALKNNWLKNYTWLKRMFKWDYNTCYEEAKKYTTRTEFHDNSPGAHSVAKKNGWIKNYTWFKKFKNESGFWNNKEICMNEAKKYNSAGEFIKGASGAYSAALRHGWLDNYKWSKEKENKWTEETCLREAKKYQFLKDFYKNASSAYKIARKNGWIDNYTWLKRRVEWNNESVLKEAKRYNSRLEFQKGSPGAYDYAIRHNILDTCTWFNNDRKPNKFWNYSTCYEEAKKYKSRKEFENGSPTAYYKALKNNWLDDYNWFLMLSSSQHKHGYWTKERCAEESKKYKTMKEFKKNCSNSAYKASKKNNWLDNFTWLERN